MRSSLYAPVVVRRQQQFSNGLDAIGRPQGKLAAMSLRTPLKWAKIVPFINTGPESTVEKMLRRDFHDKEVKKQTLGNKLQRQRGSGACSGPMTKILISG
jgi:hypothetical protein